MNSFQSTSINVNFFIGEVTSSRFAAGSSATNANSPTNGIPDVDANKLALERLREILLGEGIRLNPNAQPRSATDVATQVLKRVSSALDAASDDSARIALLGKAAEGIARGVAEARQILDQAGVLNGKVAETVDAIAGQLQSGLQELAANIVPKAPVNREVVPVPSNTGMPVASSESIPAVSSQASISAGVLVQRSANISIETQDGDVITLAFNRSEAAAVAVEVQANADAVSASFAAVRVVSSDLNYSVQGELDEDEVEALDELLAKINQVADIFFGGQIGDAFKKAANLELDTEELSNYSISLQSTVVQTVVSRYQQVAELGAADVGPVETTAGTQDVVPASPVADTATASPSIADAATAVGQVAQVVDFAAQQRTIGDLQTTVPNLIETVARAKGFDVPINNLAGQSFSEALSLLRDLIADLALPAATGDTKPGEAKHHDEHGEDRDGE